MNTVRPYTSAAVALVLVVVPIVIMWLAGGLPLWTVILSVALAAIAVFQSSVSYLFVPAVVVVVGAIRAVESPWLFALCGLCVTGSIWLMDISRDARRSALIDPRAASARRLSAALVIVGTLLLVGVSTVVSVVGNDAGVYLPIGLFLGAGLVMVMARAVTRSHQPSTANDFATGRRMVARSGSGETS